MAHLFDALAADWNALIHFLGLLPAGYRFGLHETKTKVNLNPPRPELIQVQD